MNGQNAIVDIKRRYTPRPSFTMATPIVARTPTQIMALASWPNVLSVAVDPIKPYRRVWAWLFNDNSGAWRVDYDLVATMNGEETYRQKLMFASNAFATTSGEWVSNICGLGGFGTNVGTFVDAAFTYIGATPYAFIPWQLNVTCDTIAVQVNRITGSLAHNGMLIVNSQPGI